MTQRKMKIKSADLYRKDLNESENHLTIMDIPLSENPVILIVKDLQVGSCEDEEVLIEYTLVNAIPFKYVVDCVVNNEIVLLTKEDMELSNTKIENWLTQQNK